MGSSGANIGKVDIVSHIHHHPYFWGYAGFLYIWNFNRNTTYCHRTSYGHAYNKSNNPYIGITPRRSLFFILGLILSSPPSNAPSNIMMISSLVRFSLVFISGIFIPLENMPYWGKIIASFSPLTYFTDLTRYTLQGTNYYPVLLDFILLLGFSALFFILAVKLHQRTIYKRL